MSRNKLQKVLDIKFIIAVIIIILLCAVLVYTRKEAKAITFLMKRLQKSALKISVSLQPSQ